MDFGSDDLFSEFSGNEPSNTAVTTAGDLSTTGLSANAALKNEGSKLIGTSSDYSVSRGQSVNATGNGLPEAIATCDDKVVASLAGKNPFISDDGKCMKEFLDLLEDVCPFSRGLPFIDRIKALIEDYKSLLKKNKDLEDAIQGIHGHNSGLNAINGNEPGSFIEVKAEPKKKSSTAKDSASRLKCLETDEFCIDSEPCGASGDESKSYSRAFQAPLSSTLEDEIANSKNSRNQKSTCFNCDGSHNLKDCTEPKDQQKIRRNIKIMKLQQQESTQGRYHADEDPRFANFKPGTISDDLRKALGLNPKQLEPWIYAMRVFGYPPGYKEVLKVKGSGITIFDDDGKLEKEETTTTAENMSDSFQYDMTKIIEYPGYNVPLNDDIIDEHSRFNMPAFDSEHGKERFEEELLKEHGGANITPERQAQSSAHNETITIQSDDESPDYAEINIASQPQLPPLPPPPVPPEMAGSSSLNDSIECLESKRMKLIQALEDNKAEAGEIYECDKGEDVVIIDEVSTEKPLVVERNSGPSVTDTADGRDDTPQPGCIRLPSRSASKSMDLGTPTLKRTFTDTSIPSLENFSRDVQPFAARENNDENARGILRRILTAVRKRL